MNIDDQTLRVARLRIGQIFRYLKSLNEFRNPAKRRIEEQPWVLWLRDLPAHASIQKGEFQGDQNTETNEPNLADSEILAGDDFIIKVSRPLLTQPPTPPDPISAWLEPGWESVDGKVRVKDSIIEQDAEEQETELHFDDDVQRLELLVNWQEKRDEWVSTEKPARAAFKIFERLYELYGQIQRESERLELVLGDGILVWRRPEGGIKHPVLLQRLQLEFDPEIPEFTISESEYAVEIYTALFSAMSDVDGRKLGECQSELRSGTHHPLDTEMTSAFLRSLVQRLSAHGEFIEREQMHRETDHPQITRDPVIFLRTRTLGFSAALESILQDIEKREEFPHSLLNIVGLESAPVTDEAADPGTSVGAEDEDILLSKPANAEQLQIAQRLEKFGSVLVQGPPGTGKTHTIANLIGHLLAQGKSVLVTSHGDEGSFGPAQSGRADAPSFVRECFGKGYRKSRSTKKLCRFDRFSPRFRHPQSAKRRFLPRERKITTHIRASVC